VLPNHVDIDLTNVCNQDCFYCNSADFRAKNLITGKTNQYLNLLDQLANWKQHTPHSIGSIRSMHFTGGGEPTVHKNIGPIMAYAIDKGFHVSLISNGSKLHRVVEGIPKDKIEGVAWIGIDIDSARPETYESIRRSLTRDTLYHIVVKNTNEDEINALFEMVSYTGARQLHIRPFVDMKTKKLFEVTDELKQLIQTVAKKHNVKYRLPLGREAPRTYSKCHQMFLYPILAANGDICVCCEGRGKEKFLLGNWKNQDIRDLWWGEKHLEIYNSVNTHLCPPCKPNRINNLIQEDIDDPSKLERVIM
jgi:MoaA/NifB/PqqE/SkfB family radical SAM enzyme